MSMTREEIIGEYEQAVFVSGLAAAHRGRFIPRLHEERCSDHRSVLLTLRD